MMGMCGVASHNVTHDVTGSLARAKRNGVHVNLCTVAHHSIGLGGTGVQDDSSNCVYQKT